MDALQDSPRAFASFSVLVAMSRELGDVTAGTWLSCIVDLCWGWISLLSSRPVFQLPCCSLYSTLLLAVPMDLRFARLQTSPD